MRAFVPHFLWFFFSSSSSFIPFTLSFFSPFFVLVSRRSFISQHKLQWRHPTIARTNHYGCFVSCIWLLSTAILDPFLCFVFFFSPKHFFAFCNRDIEGIDVSNAKRKCSFGKKKEAAEQVVFSYHHRINQTKREETKKQNPEQAYLHDPSIIVFHRQK